MKLTVKKRETGRKGEINQIRRDGDIPAVIYGMGGESSAVTVKGDEIRDIIQKISPGRLATTVFEINHAGKTVRAIVKDIQYHFATYNIEHMDLLEMKEDSPVTVSVPIEMHGVAECAGVKLGGFLRQVVRSLKVSCLPKDIPQNFVIDVQELGLGQTKTFKDLSLPSNVRPLVNLEEVIVVIRKKAGS